MEVSVLQEKKFLFVTGSSGRRTMMIKMAKELMRRFSVDSFFLSFSTKTENLFAAEGVKEDKIIHLVYPGTSNKIPNIDFLMSRENVYCFNIFDLWQLFAIRNKKRLKIGSEQILQQMEFYIKHIENLAETIKPDYIFIIGISVFHGVLVQKIFSKNKIPVLELTNSRIPGRFTFDTTLEAKWPLVARQYKKIKKDGLTPPQEKIASEFMYNFRLNPVKPDDSARVKESLKHKIKRYYSYKNTLLYRREIPNLRFFLWYPFKDWVVRVSFPFEHPISGEKYVFFPLQIQPEASTSIWAKWYCNQLALIENIAKSIPCGYKLYVKEHVKYYSIRPAGFHKEIKKHPNIRLIGPVENTINIIQNSSLVITITGTTGWEAILLQKPVLTFGNVFYNLFDEVGKVNDFSHLPELIKNKINQTVDLQKTLEFISAMLTATFDGIGVVPGDCQNNSLTEENIIKIVEGIERFVKIEQLY